MEKKSSRKDLRTIVSFYSHNFGACFAFLDSINYGMLSVTQPLCSSGDDSNNLRLCVAGKQMFEENKVFHFPLASISIWFEVENEEQKEIYKKFVKLHEMQD